MQLPWERIDLPVHATRRWKKRHEDDIEYLAFHQAAATASLYSIARYHTTPSPDNHISKRGAPGVCYTVAIDPDGTIYQCTDITDVTWSNGKVKTYRRKSNAYGLKLYHDMNKPTLSVLVNGDFAAPGYKAGEPTEAQLASCMEIARWAHFGPLDIPKNNILGHCHINKKCCPGFTLTQMIEDLVWTGAGLKKIDPPMVLGAAIGAPLGEALKWGAGLIGAGTEEGQKKLSAIFGPYLTFGDEV